MNWKAEAKEKLQRYDAMRLATINIPEEIARLELDARSIRAARADAPVTHGGNRREEALLNNFIQFIIYLHYTRFISTFDIWDSIYIS